MQRVNTVINHQVAKNTYREQDVQGTFVNFQFLIYL